MTLQSKNLDFLNEQPSTVALKKPACGDRGWPDILVFGKLSGGIEIKEGDDTLKPIQYVRLCEIVATGNIGYIVCDPGHTERLRRSVAKMDKKYGTTGIKVMTLNGLIGEWLL